jgi:hypothetical protein
LFGSVSGVKEGVRSHFAEFYIKNHYRFPSNHSRPAKMPGMELPIHPAKLSKNLKNNNIETASMETVFSFGFA